MYLIGSMYFMADDRSLKNIADKKEGLRFCVAVDEYILNCVVPGHILGNVLSVLKFLE